MTDTVSEGSYRTLSPNYYLLNKIKPFVYFPRFFKSIRNLSTVCNELHPRAALCEVVELSNIFPKGNCRISQMNYFHVRNKTHRYILWYVESLNKDICCNKFCARTASCGGLEYSHERQLSHCAGELL